MKKITCLTLIFFFILQILQSGYGNSLNTLMDNNTNTEYIQYLRSDYLAVNKKEKTKENPNELTDGQPTKNEPESPLRRFEIAFFISAPFVFMVTFLTLHTYDVIKKRNGNVNVWKDYKPALLIGTFGISSAIATREAWIYMENNDKKKSQDLQGLNDQTFFLYVYKNY